LNSLTYKAAYTILAFNKNKYKPKTNDALICETAKWLSDQQEASGGVVTQWEKMFIVHRWLCLL